MVSKIQSCLVRGRDQSKRLSLVVLSHHTRISSPQNLLGDWASILFPKDSPEPNAMTKESHLPDDI
jgi:hypothetical protein